MSERDHLARRRSDLSPARKALLSKLARGKSRGEADPQRIPRRSGDGPVALSYGQQRLWFLDQLVPQNAAYNIPLALHLQGRFQIDVIERCLNEIIRRHETLRTTFQVADGSEGLPRQVIAPFAPRSFNVVDVSTLSSDMREKVVRQLIFEDAMLPFDLVRGPLFRATILRLNEQEHMLLANMHHSISDSWSLGIFYRELTILYTTFASGQASLLPELPVQYADYVLWQQGQQEKLAQQLTYWKQQFSSPPPLLELPTDHPRPVMQTFRGSRQTFQLDRELLERLQAFGQREGVTLFMTLLTAFLTLLSRWTEQDDITVGTPIANRLHSETEGMIGFFANTLALRADLAGDPRFRELLHRVSAICLQAYAHQDVPFEQLVDALNIERNLSHNPLFQVMLVLQNVPFGAQELQLPDLKVRLANAENETAKFDLWLSLTEGPDGLSGVLEYNRDLFEAETITRLIQHFQTLLRGILADPDQRLSDLPLLTAEELDCLRAWNDTALPLLFQQLLPHRLEMQAQRTPDAIAVVFEEEQLSYRELHGRANQLAYALQSRGVGPETLVGICLHRSLDLVVGLLAILKAGGAYVPLDPTYPADRLAFLLQDAQISVLIAHHDMSLSSPQSSIIRLPGDWSECAQYSAEAPAIRVEADHLAYTIYTSGSTGQPKGAMNTHRGISNRLGWMQHVYQLDGADRVLQKTPISFDVSVWEFFWPLSVGACLILARPEGHRDSGYLVDVIRERAITTLHFVPSMLRLFLEEPEASTCTNLRRVICSGEALPFDLQEAFFARLSVALHNLYGPTEAAVDVTSWVCGEPTGHRIVPIGRPIANIQIHVLDRAFHPVPVGMPGELYIGGVGLARGYLRRPGLTAERFLPDPFSTQPGGRLYRTGDRVRLLPRGEIEFLGRVDDQIKLRGLRIEPGEIEAVLTRHPDVLESVVLLREDAMHNQQLVGYVLPAVPGEPTADHEGATPEQVSHWQQVFNAAYREPLIPTDVTFNTVSWKSSYTGEPFSDIVMREWVEQTVERLRECQPRRVLEIGCGMGLLLFPLAPACEFYLGTDVSEEALHYLRANLSPLPQVVLEQRAADDMSGLPVESFDLVILNSVAQYFPNVSYLLTVIEQALKLLTDDGSLFLGDIRSLPLLELFHVSVEWQRASASLSSAQLWQRVRKRSSQESELVIDPAFFMALSHRFPQIGRVEIQLKRGRQQNELTQFRYDVIVRKGAAPASADEPVWQDWQGWSLSAIEQVLQESEPEHLALRKIPNARVQRELQVQRMLNNGNRPETVEAMRSLLEKQVVLEGVDPEDVWELGARFAYTVKLCWSEGCTDGSYDALLVRDGVQWIGNMGTVASPRPWHMYTNHPLWERISQELVPQLRAYLKQSLPEYMIPSAFVVLDQWPLSPNGKLDRRALPDPPVVVPEMAEDFVAPRTEMEETLAAIWAGVLGLEWVGVTNNFFELGGDSIRSILIISRARRAGLRITPTQMFQHQTISELAAVVTAIAPVDPLPSMSREPASERGYSLADFPLAKLDQHSLDLIIHANPAIEDIYPLSPLQTHMLSRYLAVPEHGLYLLQRILPIQGNLNISAFEQAWQEVVARHPLMRTSFIWEGVPEPLQVVHRSATISLEQQDWSELSASEQEEQLENYLQSVQACGLELAKPTTLRLLVARVAEQRYQFVYSNRYISTDGWSFMLLLNEALICYNALIQGQELQRKQGRPYQDYLIWLQQQDMAAAESFWREQLQGFTGPTPLAERIPGNTGGQESGFARKGTFLSAVTTAALGAFARQHHLTLNTVLQGAWAMLLSYYSGEEDVTFGASVSGRPADLEGVESIVGVLMNTLPARVHVRAGDEIVLWLHKLQQQQVELRQYEYTPLPKIYEWKHLPRNQFLFESYLVVQNFQGLAATLERPVAKQEEQRLYSPKMPTFFIAKQEYPLRIDVFPGPEIELILSYYQRSFNAATISTMLKHWQIMLESIVDHPERSCGELLLLLE